MADEVKFTRLEMAIGGEYRLPDGRVFWMDKQAVAEVMRRLEEIMDGQGVTHRFEKIASDELNDLQLQFVEQNQKWGAAERKLEELLDAAELARSALDGVLGDSDSIHAESDSPVFRACQALSAAIEGAGRNSEAPGVVGRSARGGYAEEAARPTGQKPAPSIADVMAERDEWKAKCKAAVWADSEELKDANAFNAALIAALEPFVQIEIPEGAEDGTWVAVTKFCNNQITASQVRKARAAIAKAQS